MTYRETLDYLFSQLPMYQRIGAAAYKADLNTTWELLEALGNPQQGDVKFIHVAGTNGKGSVSHMIASVLQEAGFSTGLFTSPHLKDFRERIRINGTTISEEAVVQFVHQHQTIFAKIQPSFFEMSAALALLHFKESKVDFAVLETGMGGRLDSTNVVDPVLSVITNIGMDHTQFLGNSITEIAAEKAGIIKPKKRVVAGQMNPEALAVIKKVAQTQESPLHLSEANPSYSTDLKGSYQQENVATAVAAIQVLRAEGSEIKDQHIIEGLKHVVQNTNLMGRWQTLSTSPLTICDVGHNADGLKQVVQQLNATPHEHLHFVLGMVGDKNADEILSLLPRSATYYFCAADIQRALEAEKLQAIANAAGLIGKAYPSVQSAFDAAKMTAHPDELIFIGGSVFVVAEVL